MPRVLRRSLAAIAVCTAGVASLTPTGTAQEPPKVPGPEGWGEVRLSAERAPAADFAVSPSGTEIAFIGSAAYHLYDVASGRVTRTVPTGEGSMFTLAYSPDGKTIATSQWDAGLKLRDAESGRVTETIKLPDAGGSWGVTYLADGTLASFWKRAPASPTWWRSGHRALPPPSRCASRCTGCPTPRGSWSAATSPGRSSSRSPSTAPTATCSVSPRR